jgi:hypothetical protein
MMRAKEVCENPKRKPQISPLRFAPVEMTILWRDESLCFQEDPRNCRSLGFARDDNGAGDASIKSSLLDRRRFSPIARSEQRDMTLPGMFRKAYLSG